MIKQIAPVIANSTAFERFIGLLERADGERADLVRILTYHRVDEPNEHPWLDAGLISASPELFEAQMRFLAANFEVVSVQDIINAFDQQNRKAWPARAVVITFDDAYADFETHAWPVLKHYRLPVTLFVPTAFPDHPERLFWWDKLYNTVNTASVNELETPIGRLLLSTSIQRIQAYRRLKKYVKSLSHDQAWAIVDRLCEELDPPPQVNHILGWDALRRLASEGVTLGAHTRNHPIMNHLSSAEIQAEVMGSRQDLTREIGFVPLTFAYPSGIYNQEVVKVVERAGFKLAFTTERGINNVGRFDPLRLQRINVGSRTTLPVLRAQLLSWSAPLFSLSNKLHS